MANVQNCDSYTVEALLFTNIKTKCQSIKGNGKVFHVLN
jgi:hypothetical protein